MLKKKKCIGHRRDGASWLSFWSFFFETIAWNTLSEGKQCEQLRATLQTNSGSCIVVWMSNGRCGWRMEEWCVVVSRKIPSMKNYFEWISIFIDSFVVFFFRCGWCWCRCCVYIKRWLSWCNMEEDGNWIAILIGIPTTTLIKIVRRTCWSIVSSPNYT